MNDLSQDFDVVIIGGGPSGATAALQLARRGIRVAVLEKATFPRFQIGESFLPVGFDWLNELGLLDELRKLPHTRKLGAEFAMGDAAPDESTRFHFSRSLVGGLNETFNIARADFDQMLLNAAREAGATIRQSVAVERIDRLADGDVAVATNDGVFTGRWLLDASGQATVVARHLGTRRLLNDAHLRKAAYFAHFQGVERLDGDLAGFPTVAMCDEGWFWIIPLDDERSSVGLVIDPKVSRDQGVAADRMLMWGVQRCPMMAHRMRRARGPDTNMVRADFSYRCEPIAGPGYFLLGDAAMFMDPVFSTGVGLGMISAMRAADHIEKLLRSGATPETERRLYIDYLRSPSRLFFTAIRYFYNHRFRELFLHGQGPFHMERGVLALLAGHVFPTPPRGVMWRFRLFGLCIALQRYLPLVPRRRRFSLIDATPSELLDVGSQQMKSLVDPVGK